MNKIRKYLHQLHPGYSDLGVYARTILGIAIIVFLILSILQPFNFGQRNIHDNHYLTALVYAGSALLTMAASTLWIILFPDWFSEKNWTLLSEILIIIYQMSSIAATVWAINWLRGVMLPGTGSYLRTLMMVFSTGILPYTIVTFIRHNYLLKKNLAKAQKLTNDLRSRVTELQPAFLTLPGLKERIKVNELYYAEAKGNYVNLIYKKGDERQVCLCRCTMKEFESTSNEFPQLFRCHRSFVVNINKIVNVEGNAGGYFLHLPHGLPIVPVSRTYIEDFKEAIQP